MLPNLQKLEIADHGKISCNTIFAFFTSFRGVYATIFKTRTLQYRNTTKFAPPFVLCAKTSENKHYLVAMGKGVKGIEVDKNCCEDIELCNNKTVLERLKDQRYHYFSLLAFNHPGLLSDELIRSSCPQNVSGNVFDDLMIIGSDLRKEKPRNCVD